jgi:hypothetical protein
LQSDIAFSLEKPRFKSHHRTLSASNLRVSSGKDYLIELDSVQIRDFPESVIGYSVDSLMRTISQINIFQPDFKGRFTGSQERERNNNEIQIPPINIINGKIQLTLNPGLENQLAVTADTLNISTLERSSLSDLLETTEKGMVQVRNIRINNNNSDITIQRLDISEQKLSLGIMKAELENENIIRLEDAEIVTPRLTYLVQENSLYFDSVFTNGLVIEVNDRGTGKKTPSEKKELKLTQVKIPFLYANQNDIHLSMGGKEIRLPGIDLEITEVNWNPNHPIDCLLMYSQFELTGQRLEYTMDDQKINMSSERYSYSDRNKQFSIRDVAIIPTVSKEEYMKDKTVESNWINGSIDQLVIDEIDFRNILFENKYLAQKVTLEGATLYVYRDKTLAPPVGYKTLPHAMISQLPFELSIDTIVANTKRITYVENNNVSDYLGRIFFSNVDANVYHIYSDINKIRNKPQMTLTAYSLLASKLKSIFLFIPEFTLTCATFSSMGFNSIKSMLPMSPRILNAPDVSTGAN